MVSSEIRAKAREKLTGKWKKAAIIMLCFFAYSLVFSYLSNHTTGFLNLLVSVAMLVINVPIGYGLTIVFLKLFNDEEVGYFDFFTLGFENFSRAWSIIWNIFVKILVPFILVMVSYFVMAFGVGLVAAEGLFTYATNGGSHAGMGAGIAVIVIGFILLIGASIWLTVKSLYYELSQYVAVDNPAMSGKEAVEESRRLMDQKRWKLFCLKFSFIGWAILACLTLGIGFLWLMPYMIFATIVFYKLALGDTASTAPATEEPAPSPVEEPVEEPTTENTEG